MQLSIVQPVFKLELNHKVTPGIVTIAKFDGTHPCLTASAGYDKVNISINTYFLPLYLPHDSIKLPGSSDHIQMLC